MLTLQTERVWMWSGPAGGAVMVDGPETGPQHDSTTATHVKPELLKDFSSALLF